MNQKDTITFRGGNDEVTVNGEEFDRAVKTITGRVTTSDLSSDIEAVGEELAMMVMERLSPSVWGKQAGMTFDYHIATVGVSDVLKAILVAINEVRNSWKEDSAERIKTYRKRRTQMRAGQLDMLDAPDDE